MRTECSTNSYCHTIGARSERGSGTSGSTGSRSGRRYRPTPSATWRAWVASPARLRIQEVVVKRGDLIEVHRIDGHRATGAHSTQCLDHDAARRGEHHRGVELVRGIVVKPARPRRPQLFGETPMGIAAREDEDLAPPMPRHLNSQMRGGTEAKQSEPLAGPHAREDRKSVV